MFSRSYFAYVFGILGGLFIILFALVMVDFDGGSEQQRQTQMIIQAKDLIRGGNEFRGLILLQELADEAQHPEAFKILADELSNPRSQYYDIETAIYYAEQYKNTTKNGEDFYDKIAARALENWNK
jgi:hypothetical protein